MAMLSREELRQLQGAGVPSPRALLASAAELDEIARRSGIAAVRLHEAVGALAEQEGARIARPAGRHASGLLRQAGAVLVFLIAGAGVWGVVTAGRVLVTQAAEPLVVAGERGIEAYRIIERGDVEEVRRAGVEGALGRAADVVGRYTLANVAPGDVVLQRQLSDRPLPPGTLAGRLIITVALGTAPDPVPTLPRRATMFASPTADAAHRGVGLSDVLVLAIKGGAPASATLALPEAAASALNGVAASSVITLAFPQPLSGRDAHERPTDVSAPADQAGHGP